jgi:hypothetical protein
MHWHCEAVSAATRERLASQSARLDVLQISQLTGLQELCVQGFNMRGAVQGLLQLKQLQGLSARLCVGEEPWAYQKLTVLTKLERLSLGQFKPDIFVSIFGMAVSGRQGGSRLPVVASVELDRGRCVPASAESAC